MTADLSPGRSLVDPEVFLLEVDRFGGSAPAPAEAAGPGREVAVTVLPPPVVVPFARARKALSSEDREPSIDMARTCPDCGVMPCSSGADAAARDDAGRAATAAGGGVDGPAGQVRVAEEDARGGQGAG
ncbi:hypothetical protein ACSNN9_28420, partial [Micromonospora sp. URMC 107]|uniref:hypothetical protein n=1 Tax=Micromonospora sp. URMC 107 TaxID=3423418 RepID=UPI003F1B7D5C